jgi:hypothetical protein
MRKSAKELAFLRDLYIRDEWTQRFTDLVDKHAKFDGAEDLLYLNAGTGGHTLVLEERIGGDTEIFAVCGDEHELSIAADKAIAVGSRVEFSTKSFGDDAFSSVIADLSLTPPSEYQERIDDVVLKAKPDGEVAFFLPTAGSFGEIFSMLWEVLADSSTGISANAEDLISELPSAAAVSEAAERAGLVNINAETAIEVFDFETGEDVVNSPLVADFLFPLWFGEIDEDQSRTVKDKLAGLISAEQGDLSFQFTVKATVVTGTRA